MSAHGRCPHTADVRFRRFTVVRNEEFKNLVLEMAEFLLYFKSIYLRHCPLVAPLFFAPHEAQGVISKSHRQECN